MRLKLRKVACQCVIAVGVAAGLVASAPAQGNIRAVTFYTVKPDRVGDFQAEIKQYNALLVKGGSTRYHSVWLSLTGSRTYVRADYYNKWSDLDAAALPDPKMKDVAADLARLGMRITDCAESWHRVIEEVNPDLSLPDSGKIPTLIRVLVTQARADKVNDYLALVKSDILPAVKKSGAKEYTIAQARYGEPSSVITSVLGFDTWAELDEGIGVQKALGKDGYAGLLAKVTPLIVSSEYNVYRFQPELSYLPAAPAK